LRLDASYVGGINANQTLMAVVAIGSALVLFLRHRFAKSSVEEPELSSVPREDNQASPEETEAQVTK